MQEKWCMNELKVYNPYPLKGQKEKIEVDFFYVTSSRIRIELQLRRTLVQHIIIEH
jgi:hypothetical protein